jgi:hypothetical protein
MVKTFAAYRQGKLQPVEPSAGLVLGRMSEVVELLAKRLVAHDDRFQELVSVQEVERVRVTDLAARISRLEDGRLAEATPDNSNGKRVPSKYEAQCKHPRLRGPASPKQVQYVTSLGYVVPGLTKAQAHWLISNHYAA